MRSYFTLTQSEYSLKFAGNIGSSVATKLYDIISESVLTIENGVETPQKRHILVVAGKGRSAPSSTHYGSP